MFIMLNLKLTFVPCGPLTPVAFGFIKFACIFTSPLNHPYMKVNTPWTSVPTIPLLFTHVLEWWCNNESFLPHIVPKQLTLFIKFMSNHFL